MFGMTIADDIGNKRVIPFLAAERSAFLEYDLSEAIYLLSHQKSTLGIISGLPILGKNENNVLFEKWEIVNQLEKFYNLKQITSAEDFADIDLLLIVYPKDLTDELKEKIAEIRRVCEKKGVSFAIGGCTEKDSRDVRCALRRADELMYEDKERYYEAHKELKRRDTSC